MKGYICDQCQKRAETDYQALVPHGWYHLDRRNPAGGGNSVNLDLCSVDCLIQTAQNQRPAIEPFSPSPIQPEFVTGEGRTDEEAVAAASERQEL